MEVVIVKRREELGGAWGQRGSLTSSYLLLYIELTLFREIVGRVWGEFRRNSESEHVVVGEEEREGHVGVDDRNLVQKAFLDGIAVLL